MKLKLVLAFSILVMGLSIFYILNLLNQDFVLSKETKYEATLNVWTTTPELSVILKQFQNETNIQMNIKQFQNSELLIEELELTRLNDNAPELVEIPSDYGVYNLLTDYNIHPIDELVDKTAFHQAANELFSEENHLYAFPLGLEVPALYYNKTLLPDEMKQTAFPFKDEKTLKKFKDFQEEKNNRNANRQFWFFHFDENISWYWDSYALSVRNNSLQFEEYLKLLRDEYRLFPPFESPMAITRFVSFEVGALATSSKHIQTIQQLIGNRFEFEVRLFADGSADEVLVAGKGLALMDNAQTNSDDLKLLFEFLNTEETQIQLLGSTGMLPSQKERLENREFLQELPMAKYLFPLAKFNESFTGLTEDEIFPAES